MRRAERIVGGQQIQGIFQLPQEIESLKFGKPFLYSSWMVSRDNLKISPMKVNNVQHTSKPILYAINDARVLRQEVMRAIRLEVGEQKERG